MHSLDFMVNRFFTKLFQIWFKWRRRIKGATG